MSAPNRAGIVDANGVESTLLSSITRMQRATLLQCCSGFSCPVSAGALAEPSNRSWLTQRSLLENATGRDLSAQLCASYPHTKVLYLSGYTEDAIAHEGVLESGTAFLQKPFTLQMLSRKVREVLGERG